MKDNITYLGIVHFSHNGKMPLALNVVVRGD
ncbi:hypothetical protein VIRA109638_04200 [Vibrio rarus]